MRTIAVVNQKGGCGKTTSAISLAAVYARRGLRTLLVDADPQAHCAAGLGVPEKRIEYSIGEAMMAVPVGEFDRAALIWEVARNLDLVPSTMRLAALEAPGGGLHEKPDKDCRLHRVLEKLAEHYDRCLIDCPPMIGLLTFNALRAAREALIPVETGYFSLKGAERQWETIQRVIRRLGRPIACHLLPTLHDPHLELARDILAALRRRFAGQILPVVIHEHDELREAASMGQAIVEYAPESAASREYEALADWLEEHPVQPAAEIEIVRCSSAAGQPAEWQGGAPVARVASTAAHAPSGPSQAVAGGPPRSDGGRAAELVERLRRLTVAGPEAVEPAPSQRPDPTSGDAAAGDQSDAEDRQVVHPEAPEGRGHVAHVYGARCTKRGVLFVQPSAGEEDIFVAGDFNGWSPTHTPLPPNRELGVAEVLVPISPGRHQYRLVVGGQWRADPYNDQREANEHGEFNSVVVVPERQVET